MSGTKLKWLKIVGMAAIGCKLQDVSGNGWNDRKWLEMAGTVGWIKMPTYAWNV